MSLENNNAGQSVSDSIRGVSASDIAVAKIVYAPPSLVRVLRTIVPSIAGILAIGLFTWAYVQSYDRTNAQAFNDYVAEQYVVPKSFAPEVPLEERVEASFSPSEDISEDALADLSNVEYVLSTQLGSYDYVEMSRTGNVVYFVVGKKEYTITVVTSESYKYIDDFIKQNNKAD